MFANKVVGITGGGFIGKRLITRLFEEKALRVKVLELDVNVCNNLKQENVIVINGSVTEKEAVENLCRECSVIIHTAAIVKESGALEVFRKVNVEGLKLTAETSVKHKIETFFHFSSVMVFGFNFLDNITEEGNLKGENNPYCITKIEGENWLRDELNSKHMRVIILRPGDVFGSDSVWIQRPLRIMKKRGFCVLPGDGKAIMNHVYVDNLIDGIFILSEKGEHLESYTITDDQETQWNDFMNRIGKINGPKTKIYNIPVFLFKLGAFILGIISFLLITFKIASPSSFEDLPTMDAASYLTRPHKYSIEKIKKMGYKPKVSLESGFSIISQELKEREEQLRLN